MNNKKKKKNKLIHKCDSSLCDRTCIERNKIKITLHQMQQGSLGKKSIFFLFRENKIYQLYYGIYRLTVSNIWFYSDFR